MQKIRFKLISDWPIMYLANSSYISELAVITFLQMKKKTKNITVIKVPLKIQETQSVQCKSIALRPERVQRTGVGRLTAFQIGRKRFGARRARQGIPLISLAAACRERLDTWASARLTSAETAARTLQGVRKIRGLPSDGCLQSGGCKAAQEWVQQLRISKQRATSGERKNTQQPFHCEAEGQLVEYWEAWPKLSSAARLVHSAPSLIPCMKWVTLS